ncbi:hypothetical protein FNF28_01059 [Cafeteria roenbergensis]|uniref:DUF676 domain-containing protein n=1 Tax=Cafeteria roenbergensis TaxID=33653 RepID=A0A5A8E259_CAFRO|nr:hypothetical protein FNF28_01059 [Cafeteria roenbergensis]
MAARDHLMVMQHGLHGSVSSMHPLAEAVEASHGEAIETVIASSNTGVLGKLSSMVTTADGVAAGGVRLAAEIVSLLEARPHVHKLSVLGARTAPPLDATSSCGWNFVTVVSPATGVRLHLHPAIRFAVDTAGVIGFTGPDLTLSRAGWAAGAEANSNGSIHVPSLGAVVEPVVGMAARSAWLRRAACRAAKGPDVEGDAAVAAAAATEPAPRDSSRAAAATTDSAGGGAGGGGATAPDGPLPTGAEPVPLLFAMARPGSVFWRMLARFRNRVIAGVTEFDDKVPHEGAALAPPGPTSLHELVAALEGGHGADDSAACAVLVKVENKDSFAVAAGAARGVLGSLRRTVRPGTVAVAHAENGDSDAKEEAFPHVSGVFLQPAEEGVSGRQTGWDYDAALEAFFAWLDRLSPDTRGPSPEAVMAAGLRCIGGWTTVDLTFGEWGAAVMNHMRAANNSWIPGDTSGDDAVRFVCSRCVLR